MEAFTQTKATVAAHKGGQFSFLDGQITGEFLECVRPSKIVQRWRLRSWPEGKEGVGEASYCDFVQNNYLKETVLPPVCGLVLNCSHLLS